MSTKSPGVPASGSTPSRLESRAQVTNSAARAILDAEVKARESKTAKLRELRMKREAEAPATAPAPKKRTPRSAAST